MNPLLVLVLVLVPVPMSYPSTSYSSANDLVQVGLDRLRQEDDGPRRFIIIKNDSRLPSALLSKHPVSPSARKAIVSPRREGTIRSMALFVRKKIGIDILFAFVHLCPPHKTYLLHVVVPGVGPHWRPICERTLELPTMTIRKRSVGFPKFQFHS